MLDPDQRLLPPGVNPSVESSSSSQSSRRRKFGLEVIGGWLGFKDDWNLIYDTNDANGYRYVCEASFTRTRFPIETVS